MTLVEDAAASELLIDLMIDKLILSWGTTFLPKWVACALLHDYDGPHLIYVSPKGVWTCHTGMPLTPILVSCFQSLQNKHIL
jgi:hypothetical protein